MNDKTRNNLLAGFFAVGMFVCVFSMGIAAAADKSKAGTDSDTQKQSPYTVYSEEIGDIAQHAEVEVKEVNAEYEREKEKLESIKREQYLEECKEEPAKSLLSKEDIDALEARRAQDEKAIRSRAGYDINSVKAEQKASQKVSPASPRPVSQTSSRGMVKGIVYCENKGAALISGEVVREGDVVMGVKVVKISPRFVEFDKQGNQWKQQVGEAPPAGVWEQSQPQTQKPAPAQRPLAETKPKKKSSK